MFSHFGHHTNSLASPPSLGRIAKERRGQVLIEALVVTVFLVAFVGALLGMTHHHRDRFGKHQFSTRSSR